MRDTTTPIRRETREQIAKYAQEGPYEADRSVFYPKAYLGIPPREIEAPAACNSTGQKWDTGKKDWSALPFELLEGLASVFEAGVKKGYGQFNCLKKFDDPDNRFWNGMMRHLKECQRVPLAIDEETGCKHGYQAAFNIILRTYHAEQRERHDTSDK